VLLATTNGTPAEERDAVVAFAARRAESIIIAGSRSTRDEDAHANAELAAELDRYCRNGGRVGVVGQSVPGVAETDSYRTIAVPNEQLARDLAWELAQTHRGPFVIVAGPHGLTTSDARTQGFQRGLSDAGRPAAEVVHVAFNRNGGFDAGIELAWRIKASGTSLAEQRLCIFATNDVMAIGVAAALRDQGLKVPHDASLAGFDDIEWLRDFRPALSTVSLPLEEIGRQATLAAISDDGGTAGIAGKVTLRRSTSGS
jgi:LacI family transcriptional regulator